MSDMPEMSGIPPQAGAAAPMPAASADFMDQLQAYGDMARAALLERLPRHEPQDYLYGPIRDYIETSGKGLRPALLLATCEAFGGDPQEALTSAAVIELLHNAFLVHDDIEDVSDFRRGRECMHKRTGVPLAINMGDAMQALALRLLQDNTGRLGPQTSARIVTEFDHLLIESIEGQALELGWIRDNRLDIGPRDYLQMCLKKTCWYSFIHPMRIGALIARPEDQALDRFNAFGFFLGAAFQIQDDLLNLVGKQDVYGKEIGGDIYEGKRTLMLSRLATRSDDGDRDRLSQFLAQPRQARSDGDAAWVMDRMQDHACLDYGRQAAQSLSEAARGEFPTAFAGAGEEPAGFIAGFLAYMTSRQV